MDLGGPEALEGPEPAAVSGLRNLDDRFLFKAAQRQVAVLCDNGLAKVPNRLNGAYIDR